MQSRLDALQVPIDPRLETFPGAIGRMDVTGRLLDCNRAFAETLRYPKLALLSSGSTIFQLVTPSNMLKAFHYFQLTVATGAAEASKAKETISQQTGLSDLQKLAGDMVSCKPPFMTQILDFNTGDATVCQTKCTSWLATDLTFGSFILLALEKVGEPKSNQSQATSSSSFPSSSSSSSSSSTLPPARTLLPKRLSQPSLQFPIRFAGLDLAHAQLSSASPPSLNDNSGDGSSPPRSSGNGSSSNGSSGNGGGSRSGSGSGSGSGSDSSEQSPGKALIVSTGEVKLEKKVKSPRAYPQVDLGALLTAASSTSSSSSSNQAIASQQKLAQEQLKQVLDNQDEQASKLHQQTKSKSSGTSSTSGSSSDATRNNGSGSDSNDTERESR